MSYSCKVCHESFDSHIRFVHHQARHANGKEEDLLTNLFDSTKKLFESTSVKVQDRFNSSQRAITEAINNFELNENSSELIPSCLTDARFKYFMELPERHRANLHEWIESKHYQINSDLCQIKECNTLLGLQNGKINCQK
jgi:hypothetical protein